MKIQAGTITRHQKAQTIVSPIVGLVALFALMTSIFGWRLTNLDVPLQYAVPIELSTNPTGIWRQEFQEKRDETPTYSQVDLPLVAAGSRMILDGHFPSGATRLNAPSKYSNRDFPLVMDRGNTAIVWFLSQWIKNPVVLMNIFYLMSFVFVYIGTLIGLRLFSKQRSFLEPLLAILLAFLPFHFLKEQFFVNNYSLIPITIGMCSAVITKRTLPRTGYLFYFILLTCTGLYWSVFSLVIVAIALIVALLSGGPTKQAALFAAASIQSFALVFIFDLRPSLEFWRSEGLNTALQRVPGLLDYYGFRVSDLLLFPDYVQVVPGILRRSSSLSGSPILGEGVGTFAPMGALILIYVFLAVFCSLGGSDGLARRTSPNEIFAIVKEPTLNVKFIFCLVITAPIIASVGGLGSIANNFAFRVIKAWERYGVVFAFAAVFLVHEVLMNLRSQSRIGSAPHGSRAVTSIISLACVVTIVSSVPWGIGGHAENAAQRWRNQESFFDRLDKAVGSSSVFVFPVDIYPEGPEICEANPYSALIPFVLTSKIRWNTGAIRGRDDSRWQYALATDPFQEQLNRLLDVGFVGILYDRLGYSQRHLGAQIIEALNRTKVGVEQSHDGRWLYAPIESVMHANRMRREARAPWQTLGRRGNETDVRGAYTCPVR